MVVVVVVVVLFEALWLHEREYRAPLLLNNFDVRVHLCMCTGHRQCYYMNVIISDTDVLMLLMLGCVCVCVCVFV